MTLEQRYRRRLLAYPPTYRAERGDEMVGVLLDCAAPGQTRPTIAESFDLVRGGLTARLSNRPPYRGTAWPDAVAVISVVLPIALGARAYRYAFLLHRFRGQLDLTQGSAHPGAVAWYFDGWGGPVLWLVAAVVVVVGRPRLAFAIALLATIVEAVHLATSYGGFTRPVLLGILPFLVLEVIAATLLASPVRVRRGLAAVGRARLAIAGLLAGGVYFAALAPAVEAELAQWTQSYSSSGLLALATVVALVIAMIRGPVGLRVGAIGLALASIVVAIHAIETTLGRRPTEPSAIFVEVVVTVVTPVAVMVMILLAAQAVRVGGALLRRG